MRYLLVCFVLFFAPPVFAQALDRVVLTVGETPILESDIATRTQLRLETAGLRGSAAVKAAERLRPQIITALSDEALKRAYAQEQGITVTEERLQEALNTVAQRNGKDLAGFQATVGGSDSPLWATVEERIRTEVEWNTVLSREVRPQIDVSDDAIDDWLESYEARIGEAEYEVAEIFLPVDDPAQRSAVIAEAEQLRSELAGEPERFADTARAISAGPEADGGGYRGWLRLDEVNPAFQDVLQSLTPGNVSQPVQGDLGVHLLFLLRRRTAPPLGISQLDVNLQQIVLPVSGQAAQQRAAADLTALADSVESCAALRRSALWSRSPLSGSLGWFAVKDLPGPIASSVAGLPQGRLSRPIQNAGGVISFMVCDRRGELPETEKREIARERLATELVREKEQQLLRLLKNRAEIVAYN